MSEREPLRLLESLAGEDLPLPEGVFHLVVADSDLTHRSHQGKTAVCGASLCSSDLPPPCFGPEGVEIGFGDNPRFCPGCARKALRWSAENAKTSTGGVR